MSGWIKLHRKIADNPHWKSEPFTRGQAFVDMLMLASHSGGHIRANGMRIDLDIGQLGWSEVALAKRWKWSRGKIKRFLNELKTDDMIVQQIDRRANIITICNYREYQGSDTTDDTTGSTTDDTTDGQQTDMLQDTKKKVKKEKNVKRATFSPPSVGMVAEYIAEKSYGVNPDNFVDFYSAKGWMVGKNKMKDWKACVRTWQNRESKNDNTDNQLTMLKGGV